jgi:hypothetical protein
MAEAAERAGLDTILIQAGNPGLQAGSECDTVLSGRYSVAGPESNSR